MLVEATGAPPLWLAVCKLPTFPYAFKHQHQISIPRCLHRCFVCLYALQQRSTTRPYSTPPPLSRRGETPKFDH